MSNQAIGLQPVKLVMVTGDNNNKFYYMTPMGDEFEAEWGRIGVTSTKTRYPISKWKSQYNSKINKGYKDVTNLVKVTKSSSTHKSIADKQIAQLFDRLMNFAKKSVTDNYTISSEAVTQIQVHEAQDLLNSLTSMAVVGSTKQMLNDLFLELYAVIPRRMNKVQNFLVQVDVKTQDDLQKVRTMIDNEQKTLDVMAGQVSIGATDATNTVPDSTILDSLGITVESVTDTDVQLIKKMMGFSDAQEFRAAYRVSHKESRDRFTNFMGTASNKKIELFWHGSRNENWISILQAGLKIRPANAILTGAMFGNGIYYADKYRKSANYTSLNGSHWARGTQNSAFLALLDVHVGKQYEITKHSSECYNLNAEKLKKKGEYHSVFARSGYDLINNEYIVYTPNQSTIKYLVEVGK
jgi:poly [ADP-ribose] polymerase